MIYIVIIFIAYITRTIHIENFAFASTYGDNGTVLASSLKNFNDGTRPIWTYRYLSKYYPKLIHELLNEKDFKYDQDFEHGTRRLIKDVPAAVAILNKIKERLNTSPPILSDAMKYVFVDREYIKIPLKVNPFYDRYRHYNESLTDLNPTFDTKLIIKTENDVVVGAKVQGLKNIGKVDGFGPNRYAKALEEINYYTNESAEEEASNITMSHHEGRYRCFNTKDHDTFSELDCTIQGGKWDNSCTKNSQCPFYQKNTNYPNTHGSCNKVTGYCELPKGLKHETYKTYTGKAQCYNCADGKLGECCQFQSNPDYAFNEDYKERQKHKNFLTMKGLNWYKY